MNRSFSRANDQLRPVTIERGFVRNSPGSVLYRCGETAVLVTASLSDTVPPFLEGKSIGWLTAEYAMLPGSSSSRIRRGTDGRATEIQRLIGRSLRAVVDPQGTRPVDDPYRRRRHERRRRYAHCRDHRCIRRRRRRGQRPVRCRSLPPILPRAAWRPSAHGHRRRRSRSSTSITAKTRVPKSTSTWSVSVAAVWSKCREPEKVELFHEASSKRF